MSDHLHDEMVALAEVVATDQNWDLRPLEAMNKIREALKTIVDAGTNIDSGMGPTSADLWPKIDGIEFYVNVAVSGSQKARELN